MKKLFSILFGGLRNLWTFLFIVLTLIFLFYVFSGGQDRSQWDTSGKQSELEHEAEGVAKKVDKFAKRKGLGGILDKIKGIFSSNKQTTTTTYDPNRPTYDPYGTNTEEVYQTDDTQVPAEAEEPYVDDTAYSNDYEDEAPAGDLVEVVDTVIEDEPYTADPPPNEIAPIAGDKYRVLLGTMRRKPNLRAYKEFEEYTTVYTELDANGQYQIILGDFYRQPDADAMLNHVQDRGYKNAYIITDNADYQRNTIAQQRPATFAVPTEAPRRTNPPPNARETAQTPFVVRVGIYSKPNYQRLNQLKSIGEVLTDVRNDGLTKVMLGTFYGRRAAVQAAAKAKRMGYPDAYPAYYDEEVTHKTVTASRSNVATYNAPRTTAFRPPPPPKNKRFQRLVNKAGMEYMIQLVAAKKPALETFKPLSSYANIYTQDDPNRSLKRVLFGPFYSRQEAENAVVIAKRNGFRQVFIKKYTASESNHQFQHYRKLIYEKL